jgi:hypothetical protein
MLAVPPGEVVVTHEVADFHRERPAWRLYMISGVTSGLYEALEWQNTLQVRDSYEAFCRETAWGALYIAIAQYGPVSAERAALRLHAVLRFWEQLHSVRYIFKTLDVVLTLEELMMACSDWAIEAWCPVGIGSPQDRLAMAAERMAKATREDSMEAILRQMPQALNYARDLKHRDVLAQPALWRERLSSLDMKDFEYVSAACTSELLGLLYAWDRQFENQ